MTTTRYPRDTNLPVQQHYQGVLDQLNGQDARYLAVAERVEALAEEGNVSEALALLHREGDPAARMDAGAALVAERRGGHILRRSIIAALTAASLAGPAAAGAATATGTAVGIPTAPAHTAQATRAQVAAASARATADLKGVWQQNAGLSPMKVACAGPPARIRCEGTAVMAAGGSIIHWQYAETLRVAKGHVTVTQSPEPVR